MSKPDPNALESFLRLIPASDLASGRLRLDPGCSPGLLTRDSAMAFLAVGFYEWAEMDSAAKDVTQGLPGIDEATNAFTSREILSATKRGQAKRKGIERFWEDSGEAGVNKSMVLEATATWRAYLGM